MQFSRIYCTNCGARLRAPDGKAKVGCPRCGTVLDVLQSRSRPAPEENVFEVVEELDEVEPAAAKRRPARGDVRHRGRRKTDQPLVAWRDYLWVVAIAASVGCFFIGFGSSFVSYGTVGLAQHRQEGGVALKVGALIFTVVVGLVLTAVGVVSVKTRTFRGRWGMVITGALAEICGMVFAITGGSLAGFGAYGLLFALIRGH